MRKKYRLEASESFTVSVWMPKQPPVCIVQITHGMTEHIGRYERFAEQLAGYGILTAGFDLPGHGENEGDAICASMGEDGWTTALTRMQLLKENLSFKYPDLPVCMLGFSLGSFLLRDYLSQNRPCPDAAILMGTGSQPVFVLKILKKIIQGEIRKTGFDRTGPLVEKLSFGLYNKKFAPNRSSADWLCSDEVEQFRYAQDPFCRKSISAGLFWQLLDGMERTGRTDTWKNWNKAMPVLLISGADDPVGDAGKGVKAVAKSMQKAGMCSVKTVLLPDARHDLLHEIANGTEAKAVKIIHEFLDRIKKRV